MDRNRPHAIFQLHQIMRVGIAAQQQRLEEHHRHRPHRRRAAEPRQHHFGEQRLHREQQQRADEDRCGVDHQHQPIPGNGSGIRCGGRIRKAHESSGLNPAGAGGGNPAKTPGLLDRA
jgi:hypothetical protein